MVVNTYIYVPTHVVTLTQVGTSVYLGQTHLGTLFQVPAWVRKFSLGSTGDEISSLIIIQSLFVFLVLSSPLFISAEMIKWLQLSWFQTFSRCFLFEIFVINMPKVSC